MHASIERGKTDGHMHIAQNRERKETETAKGGRGRKGERFEDREQRN